MLVSSTPPELDTVLSPINVTVAQYLTFCESFPLKKSLERTTMAVLQVQNNNSLSLPYKHTTRSLPQIKTLSSVVTSNTRASVYVVRITL